MIVKHSVLGRLAQKLSEQCVFLNFIEKSACVKNPSPYNATPLRRETATKDAEQRSKELSKTSVLNLQKEV
ncbi:hypothetical protein H3302_00180 [Pseudoalteromonas sp. MT33b]|uniref:hypothetical protein n=1 Tax=Pseudoalteromonas sp. MT33b TaxID=2759705 RepID=UPI0015FAEF19|nr:hypothetical protein [Pseudoalteromonas sp. MT33b]QMW14587.1 hypothetical protein H3302_00180 [Pseudoalteromonas sp. MT33b]